MSKIDKIISYDSDNTQETKKALISIEPESIDIAERLLGNFEFVGQKFGERSQYDEHHRRINDWAIQLGFTGNDAIEFLQKATVIGESTPDDNTEEAQNSLNLAISILARSQLTLRLGRDFIFGLLDLLRLRISPALGFIRLQSETVGILKLILDNPSLGNYWSSSIDSDVGKKFHQDHHGAIVSNIKAYKLYDFYQRGSNMSFHPRASGTALGTLIGAKSACSGEMRLVYQEVDDPRMLFLWYEYYIRFHMIILKLVNTLFPELEGSDLDEIEITVLEEKHRMLRAKSNEVIKSLGDKGIEKLLSNG